MEQKLAKVDPPFTTTVSWKYSSLLNVVLHDSP
jgi:hypothetical protein